MANGKHLLTPGAIPIEFEGGTPKSKHPAVAVEGNEVRIRCAPVRLEIVDERGRPVAGNIKVFNDKGSLLRKTPTSACSPCGCRSAASITRRWAALR